jgi:hypothetical protein
MAVLVDQHQQLAQAALGIALGAFDGFGLCLAPDLIA